MSSPAPKTVEPSETQAVENKTELEASEPSMENKTIDGQTPEEIVKEGEAGEEEEEEGECGFCLFMKGGGCKDTFVAWENCIAEAEKNKDDIVEKCFEVTGLLKKCMEAHSDYYEPLLKAEKAAEQEALKEMERQDAAVSKASEQKVDSNDNQDG